MRKAQLQVALGSTALLVLTLAGCGGGSSSGNSSSPPVAVVPVPTPSPSPSPTPAPTPTPTPAALLITSIGAPAQASTPSNSQSLQATVGGPSFITQPTLAITFPLIQSVLTVKNNALIADVTTINGGSSMGFAYCSGCREVFDLNVPNLGLSKVELNTFDDTPFFATLSDGRRVEVEEATWGSANLKWMKHGSWVIDPPAFTNFSAYVYGFETLGSALTGGGTAVYSSHSRDGTVFYLASTGRTVVQSFVQGTWTINVNFAARTLTGQFTQTIANSRTPNPVPWNTVSFAASIASGGNSFAGIATASPAGGAAAFNGAASGTVSGKFYGPTGQEVGFVWTLADGTKAALGTVGANILN